MIVFFASCKLRWLRQTEHCEIIKKKSFSHVIVNQFIASVWIVGLVCFAIVKSTRDIRKQTNLGARRFFGNSCGQLAWIWKLNSSRKFVSTTLRCGVNIIWISKCLDELAFESVIRLGGGLRLGPINKRTPVRVWSSQSIDETPVSAEGGGEQKTFSARAELFFHFPSSVTEDFPSFYSFDRFVSFHTKKACDTVCLVYNE